MRQVDLAILPPVHYLPAIRAKSRKSFECSAPIQQLEQSCLHVCDGQDIALAIGTMCAPGRRRGAVYQPA
eukprot:1308042-Pleurochrysis_carterae.AAC.1